MPELLPYTRFAEVTINSNFAGTSAAMDSGKVQRINYDGHYYSFNIRYPSLTYDQAKMISGFLTKQGGPLNSFALPVPEISSKSSGVSTQILQQLSSDYILPEFDSADPLITSVDFGTNIITYHVSLDAPSGYDLEGFYAVGDYCMITNHNKIYQITEIVEEPVYTGISTSSTFYGTKYYYEGQVRVGPNIVFTDTDYYNQFTSLRMTNVSFRVFLTDSIVSYTASTSNDTSMTLNLREEI